MQLSPLLQTAPETCGVTSPHTPTAAFPKQALMGLSAGQLVSPASSLTSFLLTSTPCHLAASPSPAGLFVCVWAFDPPSFLPFLDTSHESP